MSSFDCLWCERLNGMKKTLQYWVFFGTCSRSSLTICGRRTMTAQCVISWYKILCLHHYALPSLPLLSKCFQGSGYWCTRLPQSQFSLETLPPLDSGTWWVWLTAASWGHPREDENWRRWRRRELSMVWPLLLIYSMDNFACLTSCKICTDNQKTMNCILLVI